MKPKLAVSRLQIALIGIALVLAASIVAFSMIAHNSANRLASRAARRQAHDATIKRLFGPEGKNVQQAMATADMMHKSVSDRLDQVMDQCDKKHISDKERSILLGETNKAGKEATNKVVASYYQAPFEPHYPPLPQ